MSALSPLSCSAAEKDRPEETDCEMAVAAADVSRGFYADADDDLHVGADGRRVGRLRQAEGN